MNLKQYLLNRQDKKRIRKLEAQLQHCGQEIAWVDSKHTHLFGDTISIGNKVHIFAEPDRHTRLTVYKDQKHQGSINISDYALISPGVRIESALKVNIHKAAMIANHVYITDCDWHDIYDRSYASIGTPKPVIIEENAWIGYGTIILKGSFIGKNSIVGAGSVVTGRIPDNVIVAGNPARLIKRLDPKSKLETREAMFKRQEPFLNACEKKTKSSSFSKTFQYWFENKELSSGF